MQTEHEDAAPSAPVKKAAAAMAVGVGSFQDPDQLQVRDCCIRFSLSCETLETSTAFMWDAGPMLYSLGFV